MSIQEQILYHLIRLLYHHLTLSFYYVTDLVRRIQFQARGFLLKSLIFISPMKLTLVTAPRRVKATSYSSLRALQYL